MPAARTWSQPLPANWKGMGIHLSPLRDPATPQNIQASKGVLAPLLQQLFLFEGYLPQNLLDYRGGGGEKRVEERCLWRSELGKSLSILPLLLQASGRACKAQLGHLPPSLPGCRAAANVLKATPRFSSSGFCC